MKLTGRGTHNLLTLMALAVVCATAHSQASQFQGSTAVNQTSAPLSVTVHMLASGVAAEPSALTQGLANADFAVASGGGCAAGTAYTAGQQCTVEVVFQPRYPGMRSGAVVLETSDGTVLGETMLSGLATGSLPVFAPGRIDTMVGDGYWLYQADGVPATGAPIFLPTGVVTDAAGNLYLSDSQNNRVRRVDAVTGLITTIAGTGTPGYTGDQVFATRTMVSTPAGMALDGAGNLYFADTGNHIVRRIDAFTGIITTVAGTPTIQGFTGDNRAATQATLSFPEDVAFDATGNLLIADTGNNVIRQVDAATGTIHTIAGTGAAGFNGDAQAATSAWLNSPWSVSAAPDGSLYLADLNNNRIRRIDASGNISTVAGTGARDFQGDGGLATDAVLSEPTAAMLDPAGDLYIADSGNNRVREVNAATGTIFTFAGTGGEQFAGDAGPADLASLYGPSALFMDAGGNLYVADMFHNRVRRISALTTALLYPTMKVGKISPPQAVQLSNDGNAGLDLTQPLFTNAALDASTTTCTNGAAIAPAATCNLGAEFAPTVVGDPVLGTITVQSDSIYTAPVISLSGEVLSIQPTATALVTSANPSLVGTTITFTATVTEGTGTLTGNIAFFDGTTQLCNPAIVSAMATCSTSSLSLGSHNITATYSGDANNAASTSSPLVEQVKQQPVLTLAVSPNPAVVTANVTLALTSTAPSGTITGTVAFYDGTTALNATPVSGTGTASYSTTQLLAGTHSLSVHYAGDALNLPAQSNVVGEVVNEASTTTVLSSSSLTATVGSSITFTALVGSASGPTPTGTVKFEDGSNSLGTATLNSGTAILTTSSLAPGNHSITAVYSGDADDATSTSPAITEIVNQIATATTLTADQNPVAAGAVLHLTAAVTPSGGNTAGGALTGTVSFHDGSTILGHVSLDSQGHATLAISTLSAATHALTAIYLGSTNYAASTSDPVSEVVQITATTITLSSPLTTTLAGQSAAFTATVSSLTGIPTGNVVFKDGTTNIGQAQLNAQGVTTFSTTTLTVGTHLISATYQGDSSYNPSTPVTLQHSVVLATTSLTLAAPSGPIDAGKAFTLSASLTNNGVAPTGALSLHDGNATIGTLTVAADGTFAFNNVVLSVGTHQLTAVYAGDADNAAATSAPVAVIVQLAPTTTTLISSVNPAAATQTVAFTATATSDSPSIGGSIAFLDGTTPLGSSAVQSNGTAVFSTTKLALGSHSITAVYSGDINHAPSTSVALTQQIVQTDTASLTSSANPSNSGASVLFTLHITGSGSGSPSPTGSVVFRDGTAQLGSSTLDGSGSATLQTAAPAVGSHTISASYAGDANYAAATASLMQTVQSASTQVTLAASANPATYAASLTLTATVNGNGGTATGTVSFTDGGTAFGTATLNAGVATLNTSSLAPGTHTIVANYAGDANNTGSVSTPLTLSVKQTTGVQLASNADPASTLSAFVLTATVTNSGVSAASGTIVFNDGTTQLGTATLDGTGRATLPVASMTAGSHPLQASYAGDAGNFASTSPVLSQVIQLRPTTITVTASATDPSNPQQQTLIAVVRWTGPVAATGTVAFTAGSTNLGSSAIDSTGVATLSIVPAATPENVVATYSGDASYATSTSAPATITGTPPTDFLMQLNPSSVTFASKQHSTVSLDLASVSGFTDTLQLGCLGLPYAATCTFSKPQVVLAANGGAVVQLTIDTGDPLGAGASASNRSKPASTVLLCLLPCLVGIAFGARRRRFKPIFALLMVVAAAMTLSSTGCSGLHINGTPPGTYTFKVTASGINTGVTLSQTMTLTVTQ
jgi:sugar lactone lactonase YvrE